MRQSARGNARALARLKDALTKLIQMGLLETFEVIKGKVITKFAARPSPSHQVRCTTDPEPPSSLQDPSKDDSKPIENKGLAEKVSALERIFRKMISTSRLPLEGGEPLELEGIGQGLVELERFAQLS